MSVVANNVGQCEATTADSGPPQRRVSCTSDSLWQQMSSADRQRDAQRLTQCALLMLVYGFVGSLGSVEEQMRRRNLNAHLIACEYVRDCLPPGVVSRNPLRPPTHRCQYYVSVNLEGGESIANQRLTQGSDSAAENLARLRADCGFLVLESSVSSERAEKRAVEAWRHSLTHFGGHVQATDRRAQALVRWAVCDACNRFPTYSVVLRPLDCCSKSFVCSGDCWHVHMDEKHGDEAEWTDDDDDDDDEGHDDNDADDKEKRKDDSDQDRRQKQQQQHTLE